MSMLQKYIFGFSLSLVLTLCSFGLVWLYVGGASLTLSLVVGGIVVLAVIQLLVQVIFFLHMEGSLRLWNISALLFAALVLFIIVAGSLWIMNHLEHNHGQTPYDGAPSPQTQHG